ncbi:tRNA (guanosine(46)-N7)-methyltransferase TrmB [Brackiella oedipodis]|uniref:tRNA (guanosine(46)-N7)-methyltransferase TrmB n=1 Tax=Brackiella oedipodis TaxID=124225 RepID=UPI000687F7F7|nr:tRNA (guanosine(46)-N7)-methyltransferase TrmB [Brackiella oedipodis]
MSEQQQTPKFASAPSGKFGRIRSFVHHRSHLSPAQKNAMDELMPQWGLAFQKTSLDFAQVFARQAPTILEIGFGMGESTLKIAQTRADENFIGVEVYNAGVGALLRKIKAHDVENIRIIQHDAVEVLEHMIAPQSLDGVHIYFPDPWPKKRHHKRRLIQADFVALLATRLKPGGYLHCATDWQDYAEQMLAVLNAEPSLQNKASDNGYSVKPDYRPQTKFETRGLRLGHGVWDLVYSKRKP